MAEETVSSELSAADETASSEMPAQEDAQQPSPAESAEEVAADATVELLQEEIRSIGAERDQFKDALIHERADFENYKKRNAALEQTAFERGTEAAVQKILPVLDNFERALSAESADARFAEGMEMIMRQLRDLLGDLGVVEIDSTGTFDPAVHHAVMQTEEDGIPSNQIVETLQKGYRMGDKIVRAAMVKVNR